MSEVEPAKPEPLSPVGMELRVKIGSLAAEARIIRKWEIRRRRVKDHASREKLYLHRVNVLRPAARHAQLALAFLRGRRYRQVENDAYLWPDFYSIRDEVNKFRDPGTQKVGVEHIREWLGLPPHPLYLETWLRRERIRKRKRAAAPD